MLLRQQLHNTALNPKIKFKTRTLNNKTYLPLHKHSSTPAYKHPRIRQQAGDILYHAYTYHKKANNLSPWLYRSRHCSHMSCLTRALYRSRYTHIWATSHIYSIFMGKVLVPHINVRSSISSRSALIVLRRTLPTLLQNFLLCEVKRN